MKKIHARRVSLALFCLAVVSGCVEPGDVLVDEGDAGSSAEALSPLDWTRVAPNAVVSDGSHHNATIANVTTRDGRVRTIMVRNGGGTDHDGHNLFWNEQYDDGSWTQWPQRIYGQMSGDRPSIAAFNGYLYMVHPGSDHDSTAVWVSRFDPNTSQWSEDYLIEYRSRKPPALAVLGDRMYIVGIRPSDRKLWMASFDRNENLSGITYLDHQYSSNRVSLTNYRGRIAMVHSSQAGVVYNEFDGTRWLGETLVAPGGTAIRSNEPSIAVSGNRVHMIYQPEGSSRVWFTTFDGNSWTGSMGFNFTSHTAPTVSRVAGRLLLLTNADCGDWRYCRPIDYLTTYQYLDR